MRLPTHGIANRNPAIKIRPADILPHRVVKNRARVSEAQLPDLLQVIYGYRGHGDWMTSYYGLQLLALGYGDSLALAGAACHRKHGRTRLQANPGRGWICRCTKC